MEKVTIEQVEQEFKKLDKLDQSKRNAVLAMTEKIINYFIKEKAVSGENPLVIYGTDKCPDCMNCLYAMDKQNVKYQFRNITDNLQYLKEYTMFRDSSNCFDDIKNKNELGIPFIYVADHVQILDWKNFLANELPKDEADLFQQLAAEIKKNK